MYPYKVLGVTRTATTVEVKRQYKKLSKLIHPDVNEGKMNQLPDAVFKAGGFDKMEILEHAQAAFADLSVAYELLGNPDTLWGGRPRDPKSGAKRVSKGVVLRTNMSIGLHLVSSKYTCGEGWEAPELRSSCVEPHLQGQISPPY